MKNNLLVLFFLGVAINSFSQYSNTYSQYMFNGLMINPAYAGASKALDVTLISRNQWTGFDGSPTTTSFSAHTPLRKERVNVGLSYISDRYGITNNNIMNIIYAYRIRFTKGSIAFGIQAGLDVIRSNWDNINITSTGDAVFTGQSQKKAIPDFGSGVYYETKNLYAGISSPSLLNIGVPNIFSKNTLLFTSGMLINISDNYKLKPSVLVKYMTHSPPQIDFNLNTYYKTFCLGFSYRTNDALVFLVQYSANKQFSIGYSYDRNISQLSNYNSGSHELMLRYIFKYDIKAKSPRYF